jgi:adenylate cyclase
MGSGHVETSPLTPITLPQVAERSGVRQDAVRRFVELGIVPDRPDGSFRMSDVLRIRLALALEGSGVSLEELGRGIETGHVSFDFADDAMTAPIGLMGRSYREKAAELGLSGEMLESIRSSLGASRASPDDPVREDDAEMMSMAAFGQSIGLSAAGLLRTLRVFNENVRRVVEFELELFRAEIEQPLLDAGMSEQQMLDQMARLRGRLEPFSGRLMTLLHRRQEEHAFFQDVIEHIENALDRAGLARRRTPRAPAIALLEVSGYARLTEGADGGSTEDSLRLGDIVQDALAFGGRAVSLLGDVVMLHFTDPGSGVAASLHLVDRITRSGLPEARVGMHAGPVVVRDGEYFGRTVNVASRVAEYARPGEVLVTAAVKELAGGSRAETGNGIAFEEIGEVTLRGLAGAVNLFLATAEGSGG